MRKETLDKTKSDGVELSFIVHPIEAYLQKGRVIFVFDFGNLLYHLSKDIESKLLSKGFRVVRVETHLQRFSSITTSIEGETPE